MKHLRELKIPSSDPSAAPYADMMAAIAAWERNCEMEGPEWLECSRAARVWCETPANSLEGILMRALHEFECTRGAFKKSGYPSDDLQQFAILRDLCAMAGYHAPRVIGRGARSAPGTSVAKSAPRALTAPYSPAVA